MADFDVRRATVGDVPGLVDLLLQVCAVHAEGRPDLFIMGARKYSDAELCALLTDETKPVFVAVEGNRVLGHAFCVIQDFRGSNNMQPVVTVYIDDICVDEAMRGKGVATALYQHVLEYARGLGAHNVTLNVWSCNPGAQKFYEKMGLVPYKTGMERVLD
ncbi:GNAT family N-acetyltransferase [Paratractidigestivibacter sp.]|uniref:GNAT family N-acetyltransferase n=1 Tax=Paratractidigestivibacter sp. TaxID=2847316 RepID=UPI002ABD1C3F|nr:GNAT family N-acetyltransferase [Paratractidigestivibacter sp.]